MKEEKTLQRFFVPPGAFQSRSSEQPEQALVSGEVLRQMRIVLRLERGDAVILLDNSGAAYEARVEQLGNAQGLLSLHRRLADRQGEPALALTLYQGLLKAAKFEWVLQKGTELGISHFVPVRCQRSVAEEVSPAKLARWQKIIQEAAEQSERSLLPTLSPVLSFSAALAQQAQTLSDLAIIPWEAEPDHSLRETLVGLSGSGRRVALFIGPEGGFDQGEIAQAAAQQVQTVNLGPRILRAETAALAAAAIILYEGGDLG